MHATSPTHPKRIGFLTFGHWHATGGSRTPTAADALKQTVDLAVEAERIGLDGAYLRVHHFGKSLSTPFPLLAAMAARTERVELGTAVIDMRYENPLALAEQAAITDLLSDGRLQIGVSRGSPESAYRGYEAFGHTPAPGQAPGDYARVKTEQFRAAISATPVVHADRGGAPSVAMLAVQPQSAGLRQRIWWGAGTRQTAEWAGEQGMHLMSSTLLSEDTGVPFDELQAEQIALFRDAWRRSGHAGEPRVSVSRSVLPVTDDFDRLLFGGRDDNDQVGLLEGVRARFGRSYTGAPDEIAEELARDAAVQAADTLLLTVPNQLGVEYNARMLETIARHVAPALGWQPAHERDTTRGALQAR
ncbi:LLM class flavin-dependent oxidoreductase [Deinococcus yavapaiensis]|uniref:Alkanesulfonate monooxygenase SsuD/methylene tetrahydromethanopterin reductase-like flavin-dependent oxidoreductase (Luciferase family) n=1 Tax=Deinococcus yavapaiensis KR-236 TaxID=694435 RepID=A0A318SD16_9DEIO|nr:LLM class flavin-dependent oxidoreductase [Deinococcus yavapaiensis]PYE49917.1 alkanesulfonate monooxygenase SsuD/methylene tetrahydromethanopterin reductase-like flavin-dependent oxidoreductase (luciferase family) [Deinococcus yavapaiensis KR-236]